MRDFTLDDFDRLYLFQYIVHHSLPYIIIK